MTFGNFRNMGYLWLNIKYQAPIWRKHVRIQSENFWSILMQLQENLENQCRILENWPKIEKFDQKQRKQTNREIWTNTTFSIQNFVNCVKLNTQKKRLQKFAISILEKKAVVLIFLPSQFHTVTSMCFSFKFASLEFLFPVKFDLQKPWSPLKSCLPFSSCCGTLTNVK